MYDDKIRIKVPTADFLGNGLDIVIIIVNNSLTKRKKIQYKNKYLLFYFKDIIII